MDDEPGDVGTTDAGAGESQLDPSSGKATRDLEFALFYREDMPRLVGFLVVQGARAGAATDLAQDAMIEAYRQWDTLDSPRAWVRTVAARKLWRHIGSEQAEFPSEEMPPASLLLAAEEAEEIETRHTFLRLVRALPAGQREVMAWTYDGYRPTEIAAVLGKDPATVRSLLRAARAALRERYRASGETR